MTTTFFDGLDVAAQMGTDLNQLGPGAAVGNMGNGLYVQRQYTDMILDKDGIPTIAWVELVWDAGGPWFTWWGPWVAQWDTGSSSWVLLGGGAIESLVSFPTPEIGTSPPAPSTGVSNGDRFLPQKPRLAVSDDNTIFLAYGVFVNHVFSSGPFSGHNWSPIETVLRYWTGSAWTIINAMPGETNNSVYGGGSSWNGNYSDIAICCKPGDTAEVYLSYAESGPLGPITGGVDWGCRWHVQKYTTGGQLFDTLIVDIDDATGISGPQYSAGNDRGPLIGDSAAAFSHPFVTNAAGDIYLAFNGVRHPTGLVAGQALNGLNLLNPDDSSLIAVPEGTALLNVQEGAGPNPPTSFTDAHGAEVFAFGSTDDGSALDALAQVQPDGSGSTDHLDGNGDHFPSGQPVTVVMPEGPNNVWAVIQELGGGFSDHPELHVGLYHYLCPGYNEFQDIADWLHSGTIVRYKFCSGVQYGESILVGGFWGDGGIKVFALPILRDGGGSCTVPDVGYPVFNSQVRIGQSDPDLLMARRARAAAGDPGPEGYPVFNNRVRIGDINPDL